MFFSKIRRQQSHLSGLLHVLAGGSQPSEGSGFGKIVAASAETDADRRLSRLQEIFRQLNSSHADEVASLNQQLEEARAGMQLFKEHAKKQFEEQQEKARMFSHFKKFSVTTPAWI